MESSDPVPKIIYLFQLPSFQVVYVHSITKKIYICFELNSIHERRQQARVNLFQFINFFVINIVVAPL